MWAPEDVDLQMQSASGLGTTHQTALYRSGDPTGVTSACRRVVLNESLLKADGAAAGTADGVGHARSVEDPQLWLVRESHHV